MKKAVNLNWCSVARVKSGRQKYEVLKLELHYCENNVEIFIEGRWTKTSIARKGR